LDADDKNAIPDAAKAARLLTDIAAVSQEMDLSGLSVVEADSGLLASASQKVPPVFPDPVVGFSIASRDCCRRQWLTGMPLLL
jgi:hypothetical protein